MSNSEGTKAVSIRAYSSDRDEWKKMLKGSEKKAGELFTELFKTSELMALLRKLVQTEKEYIHYYKDDIIILENIHNVFENLKDWIINESYTYEDILNLSDKSKLEKFSSLLELDAVSKDSREFLLEIMNKYNTWLIELVGGSHSNMLSYRSRYL